MKASISDVRALVKRVNEQRGFADASWNTVGAIELYQDICGIGVDEIVNEHGGVKRLEGGGLTKNEAYLFLTGLLSGEG